MDEKKIGGESAATSGQESQAKPKVLGQVVGKRMLSAKDRLKRRLLKKPKKPGKKSLLIMAAMLLVAALVAGGVMTASRIKESRLTDARDELNAAVQNKDTSKALEHAKKVMDLAPGDVDSILAVAVLLEKNNPEEAKQYYGKALEAFKKQDNPDVDGKKAVTYWAAAGLAERAGLKDQAKQYYQKAIKAADMNNSYDQYIANDSQTALARLQ